MSHAVIILRDKVDIDLFLEGKTPPENCFVVGDDGEDYGPVSGAVAEVTHDDINWCLSGVWNPAGAELAKLLEDWGGYHRPEIRLENFYDSGACARYVKRQQRKAQRQDYYYHQRG